MSDGSLSQPALLSGALEGDNSLSGALSEADALSGTLEGVLLRGYSAYAIAVTNGFNGTIEQWLASLVGPQGDKGDPGAKGEDGYTPVRGTDYWTTEDIASIMQDVESVLNRDRITSLTDTDIIVNGAFVEAVGIPVYVSDISDYAGYGITETGWYLFCRITGKDGAEVTAQTTVTGTAGHIAAVGDDHIDVAVRFGVAAVSQTVVISWGSATDVFVFRAPDLAVRNLDYRSTFYVYDISEYATWTYEQTADETFAEGKRYFTLENGEYVPAAVTAGDPVSGEYYVHTKLHLEGMTRNITYRCSTVVDCPLEIVLPEIADDGYGAWFEIQMRHDASYSLTLDVPTGVKVASNTVVNLNKGMNVLDLQYTSISGDKVWRALNTHSNYT